MKKKVGLVFSGGGCKGAYQIGVWRALKEFGLDKTVQAVAGTSVGGLNGALFVQGNLDKAVSLWRSVNSGKILSLNKEEVVKKSLAIAVTFISPHLMAKTIAAVVSLLQFQGLFKQQGLKSLIAQSDVCQSLANPKTDKTIEKLPLYVCSLNTSTLKLEYTQLNHKNQHEIQQWLLATSAIPIIFDPVEIDSTHYVDGGVIPFSYSDNTPYTPLIENHGCTHIINIFLERTPELFQVQQSYPQVRFWNIVPTQNFDGVIDSLNFTPDSIDKIIEDGYNDTKNILLQFKDFQDTEDRYLDAVFNYSTSSKTFTQQIQTNQKIRGDQYKGPELKQIVQNIAEKIEQEERDIIDSHLDTLIVEMQENSLNLLDDAFSAITTLASTDGSINKQLEQSRSQRILGNITGSNHQDQAEINYGLNRAIYAQQQLIQKLNHKGMLTMEALVALSNKSNYLMNHLNLLYGSVQMMGHNLNESLRLMQQGINELKKSITASMDRLDKRIEYLERKAVIEDWYHQIQNIGQEQTNPYQILLEVTASFYIHTGRHWDNNEINRYTNALKEIHFQGNSLDNIPLLPAALIWESEQSTFFQQIGASQHILPVDPDKEAFFPLLKGFQMVNEQDNQTDICIAIDEKYHLDLFTPVRARDLGLEILNACRQNDRRPPLRQALADDTASSSYSIQQNKWLELIQSLQQINSQYSQNKAIQDNLSYLKKNIQSFQVVIPITGKFSSGKSTLLNKYLDKPVLPVNINPETAVATELSYGETEQLTIYYLDNRAPLEQQTIETLGELTETSDIAFVRLTLDSKKLKNRPQIKLVDMPGFDAPIKAHQKAIAQYLKRGDYFINLIPADMPFDGSIIEKLLEIRLDYQKDIVCLLSKTAKVNQTDLDKTLQVLSRQLEQSLPDGIPVGQIESKLSHTPSSVHTGIEDFEKYLDLAARSFDNLLTARYQPAIIHILDKLETLISRQIYSAENTPLAVQQKIAQLESSFSDTENALQDSLKELSYTFSQGTEKIIGSLQSTLNNNRHRLQSAAKSNSLSSEITEIIRPFIQRETDIIVQAALKKLEHKLEVDNQLHLSEIPIQIQLPAEQKENFSFTAAAIAAATSSLFFGPVGIGLTALVSGLLGVSDNSEERDEKILATIDNEVIPQIKSAVIEEINHHFKQIVSEITQQMHKQLAQEKQSYQQEMTQLKQEYQQNNKEYKNRQEKLDKVLTKIRLFRQAEQSNQTIINKMKQQ